MAGPIRWLLLSYRLPREPSTPRIFAWRKLRSLGVAQLSDGLVALPLDNRNREQFEWLANYISESHGEASLWISEAATRAAERELVSAMSQAAAEDYRAVAIQAARAKREARVARRRFLLRLRRELQRIRSRDYFPPPERKLAEEAVESLAARVEVRA